MLRLNYSTASRVLRYPSNMITDYLLKPVMRCFIRVSLGLTLLYWMALGVIALKEIAMSVAIGVYSSHIESAALAAGFSRIDLPRDSLELESAINTAMGSEGLDRKYYTLFRAIVRHESTDNGDALSKMGAIGLAQINPVNVSVCGLKSARELLSAPGNLRCGVRILKGYLTKTHGNIELALRGYNGGNRGLSNPRPETVKYVPLVLAIKRNLDAGKKY